VTAGFTLGGDLEVRRLGFGAMRATGTEVLRRAVELGINLIDTADSYGTEHGRNELLVAEALHPYPDGLVIATKGGLVNDGSTDWPIDARPERLKRCCEDSLRRLRLERIDLYQLHRPDPEVPVAESLGALRELQDEGKIRHIGVSNFSLELLEQAVGIVDVVSVQNEYNVSDRRSDDVLQACEDQGIAFIPWTPLGRGEVPRSEALAWLLGRSPVILPIPGTSSVDHLEEIVRWAEAV
jgi:aryl-alcohol dehydrogenase-like predicted oxidoreductase